MKISFGIHFQEGPWGGGNQFLKALAKALERRGHEVFTDLKVQDLDLILLVDPRAESVSSSFQGPQIHEYLQKNPDALIIHRVNECDERKGTQGVNQQIMEANQIADHTIFVSGWLRELYRGHGMDPESSEVILNGADPEIFYPRGTALWNGIEPMKLVTHHWGNNWLKGFDVYQKIDQALENGDFAARFEFTYVGRVPDGFQFQRVRHVAPISGEALAEELCRHHVYVTASRNEPGGNHQNEGGCCGLPLLYINHASMPEYCRGYGIPFEPDQVLEALDAMRQEYAIWKKQMPSFPCASPRAAIQYADCFSRLLARRGELLRWRPTQRTPRGIRALYRKIRDSVISPTPIPYLHLVDGANWALDWVGRHIVQHLKKDLRFAPALLPSREPLSKKKGSLLHFGSRYALLNRETADWNSTNRAFLTWLHGDEARPEFQPMFEKLREKQGSLERIITSCTESVEALIRAGIPKSKISIIPLGVDIRHFRPPTQGEREKARAVLGIPEKSFCLGSFQKDGEGWGDGESPKWVKGPETFLAVLEQLRVEIPELFVLLTGPSRAYVKTGLERLGIPYRHHHYDDYLQMTQAYHALDLYLITSRCEGGPLGMMESWATRVPVVSTRMGMPRDWGRHGENAWMAGVDDAEGLARGVKQLRDDEKLRNRVIAGGIETVPQLDWEYLTHRYVNEIFLKESV